MTTAVEVVQFIPEDSIHGKVIAPAAIKAELRQFFTFEVPSAKFQASYRRGHWDGTISLFKNNRLYMGLERRLYRFCKDRGYPYHTDIPPHQNVSDQELEAFIAGLDIPDEIERRDYQFDALRKGVHDNRAILLSPTASGKSLIIYMLLRWHMKKTLIIVPRKALVHQIAGDFVDYGCDPDFIHVVQDGDVWSDKPITISTWQTVVKQSPEWLSQFEVVIGDEAHTFAAKSLVYIMENLSGCEIRYGLTGSLDDSKVNQLVLEGLFGPVYTVTTTRELIDAGHVSDLKVEIILLKHPPEICKALHNTASLNRNNKMVKKLQYQAEVDYLIRCKARNEFLRDLAINLSGNTLLLYHRVEDHGQILADMIREYTDRPVYFIHGGVDGEERNDVRAQIEEDEESITVASVGTFSTGINIKRIHNIIAASSWKSRVMNLQSIGRGLRKADDKTICNFYDITDDLSWKKKRNFTILHGEQRIKLYNEQGFEYSIHKVQLDY